MFQSIYVNDVRQRQRQGDPGFPKTRLLVYEFEHGHESSPNQLVEGNANENTFIAARIETVVVCAW